jgi:hypothetical protein
MRNRTVVIAMLVAASFFWGTTRASAQVIYSYYPNPYVTPYSDPVIYTYSPVVYSYPPVVYNYSSLYYAPVVGPYQSFPMYQPYYGHYYNPPHPVIYHMPPHYIYHH